MKRSRWDRDGSGQVSICINYLWRGVLPVIGIIIVIVTVNICHPLVDIIDSVSTSELNWLRMLNESFSLGRHLAFARLILFCIWHNQLRPLPSLLWSSFCPSCGQIQRRHEVMVYIEHYIRIINHTIHNQHLFIGGTTIYANEGRVPRETICWSESVNSVCVGWNRNNLTNWMLLRIFCCCLETTNKCY